MKIARIINEVIEVNRPQYFFPNTSFPAQGPNDDFLAEHGFVRVVETLPVSEGEALEVVEPYLLEGQVYTVQVGQAPAPEVPSTVTMRQARLALFESGILANVQIAIDSLSEPLKTAAAIEWEYSQEVHRDKALVTLLAAGLGLTNADLDALFTLAATK